MQRTEIVLSGLGGQGLLLAGLILGDAAAISEGKFAVQTESYAPLARGGASKSEIVISDEEIDYPRVRKADILVALSQDAYDSCISQVKPDGLVLVESELVKTDTPIKTLSLPLTQIARDSTGKAFTVSIVGLGVISRVTRVVDIGSLLTSINYRAPRGTEDINKKAAEAGARAADMLTSES